MAWHNQAAQAGYPLRCAKGLDRECCTDHEVKLEESKPILTICSGVRVDSGHADSLSKALYTRHEPYCRFRRGRVAWCPATLPRERDRAFGTSRVVRIRCPTVVRASSSHTRYSNPGRYTGRCMDNARLALVGRRSSSRFRRREAAARSTTLCCYLYHYA